MRSLSWVLRKVKKASISSHHCCTCMLTWDGCFKRLSPLVSEKATGMGNKKDSWTVSSSKARKLGGFTTIVWDIKWLHEGGVTHITVKVVQNPHLSFSLSETLGTNITKWLQMTKYFLPPSRPLITQRSCRKVKVQGGVIQETAELLASLLHTNLSFTRGEANIF